VGTTPQQIVIDEASHTIYVGNQGSNSVSVIDSAHCNAIDVSACNQAWPTVAVGAGPQGLGFNSNRRTLYVANRNDNSVSVISSVHCNGSDTSGCASVATVPVGAGPRAIAIVDATNSVYVSNRDDLTVSVFDGSRCNGSNVSGCPQSAPPAFIVGAFPDSGGVGNNLNGRSLIFDSRKHTLYMPNPGDSDLASVDTNQCRAGHVNDCHVRIEHNRAGGFPVTAALDEMADTVYVVNDADGTVSLFRR
jgi:YVTN family beta-propeller protein